ncbi:MAG: hypothetical protein P8L85_09475 [Rubripirellula sp.]|nr:hypothetical protein [Rubripirellula sp.]
MIRPETKWWPLLTLGMLGVAAGALLPWLHSFQNFPDESIAVSTIYRGDPPGDIQYFPLISQLSRGTITDGTIKELDGSVLRSFPHATIFPHAISIAAFGSYGFLVADIAVTVCYFLLVVLLFRTMGIPEPASTLAGCFLALNIPLNLVFNLTLGPVSSSFPFLPDVWGMRIPRPFVSELFLVAALIAVLRLLIADRTKRSHWLWLAFTFGILLQGDVYAALTFALISPCLIIVIARRDGVRPTCQNCLFAGILFTVVVAPFLLQRWLEHPDIPNRWGVFELDRMAGFRTYWRQLVAPTFAIALVLLTRISISGQKQPSSVLRHNDHAFLRTWWFLAMLLFAAFSCASISILILGKTIQPYHFNDRAERLCGYVVMISFAYLTIAFCERTKWKSIPDRWKAKAINGLPYAAMTALFFVVLGYNALAQKNQNQTVNPVRSVYYAHATDVDPSYRSEFSELTQFMKANLPQDAVVASFDHQVFAWWLTFHGRYWFLVEPFVSSIPDRELELRLSLLCNLLGMSTEDFLAFIQTPIESQPNIHGYVNVFWLGLAKYQASRLHTFAPSEDYTPEQQQLIPNSDYTWQTIIPQSELSRLAKQYGEITMSDWETRSIDAIVLSNGMPELPWAPPTTDWELVFQNNAFRLFTRIQ